MTKSLEKILFDLEDLGFSERKVVNYLKKIKEDLVVQAEDDRDVDVEKYYNKSINELLFCGKFDIEVPTQKLLGLRKILTKQRGAEYVYFLLTWIIRNDFFFKEYHDKTDEEKSNLLMFKMREYNVKVSDEYARTKTPPKEPMIDKDMLNQYTEDENDMSYTFTPPLFIETGDE
ncbi:MAG: hypothetical protein ACRCRT_03700 [Cetobacterium somerae]